MQPYFLPYIGYFQLIAAVDAMVLYDNVKYTKKGWINRNRMLMNGAESTFSLPLKAAPDQSEIGARRLAENFDRVHLLARLLAAYRRAPFFGDTRPLLEEIILCPHSSLFDYLLHSLRAMTRHLAITTPLIAASTLDIDPDLRGQDRVLALCGALGATRYTNPPGGVALYRHDAFARRGVELQFLRPLPFSYPQPTSQFVPWLSIVDVLMYAPLDQVRARMRDGHELF